MEMSTGKSVQWIFVICLASFRIREIVSGDVDSLTSIYVKAKEGTPVEIPCACPTSKQDNHVTWSKVDSKSLVISRKGRRGKITIGHEWDQNKIAINGTALKIESLQYPRDHGQFSCESAKMTTDVTITVLAPVKQTEIIGVRTINNRPRLDVVEETPTPVLCKAIANPPPTFKWLLASKQVKQDPVPLVSDPNTAELLLRVSRDMDMEPITCKTASELQGTDQATAYLRVLYPPSDVTVAVTSLEVVVGEPVTFSCKADGQPEPEFNWDRLTADNPPRTVSLADSSSVYRITSVSRTDEGEYKCTAKNDQGTAFSTISITVLHPPVLAVQFDRSSMTMTCSAELNPSGVKFGDWEQRLDGRHIATKAGITQGETSQLHLSSLTYEDTGFYVCFGSNFINTSESTFYLQPETKAIFPHNQTTNFVGLYGRRFLAPISFYVHPSPSIIRWDKTQVDGRTPQQPFRFRKKPANLTLTFHNKSAQILGTKVVLIMRRLWWSNAGNYTLTVGNRRGLSVFRFTINVDYPRLGRSESPKLGPLTVGLIVAGGCILIFTLALIVICIWRRTTKTGRLSKSSNERSFSPAEGKSFNPKPTDTGTTDTFHTISPSDVMLKEDVNENLNLSS